MGKRNTDSTIADILEQGIVRVQLADNGRAEDAKRVCHTDDDIRSAISIREATHKS